MGRPPGEDSLSRQEALERAVRATDLFCFLDYDGTLAPIAPTPAEARPVPGTVAVLSALATTPHTQIAIVSGRTIADLRSLLDISGVYYVGVHGVEMCRPDGSSQTANGVALVTSYLPMIKQHLEREVAPLKGALIEDKGVALACHYRLASRADAATARQTVSHVALDYQRRGLPIDLLHGHEVTEIRPASITKGTAVLALLAKSPPATVPLYVGDDRTDVEAFASLPSNGIAVHVGPSPAPPAAHFVLADPYAVHAFLQELWSARASLQNRAR